MYRKAYFNANNLDYDVPSMAIFLLQEFNDVFLEDIPSSLPLLRGIEHQIDHVLGVAIPNQPANRSSSEETQKLPRQVKQLMIKE